MNLRLMELQQSFTARERFKMNAQREIQKCLGGYIGEPYTERIRVEISQHVTSVLQKLTESNKVKVDAEMTPEGRLLFKAMTPETDIVIKSIYENTEFEEIEDEQSNSNIRKFTG